MNEFILLDFETTGLDPVHSEIIEVGAILVRVTPEALEIQGTFDQLVRPREAIPTVITRITGITNEMVENQPEWKEVLPGFLEFMGDRPVVAHNSSMEEGFLSMHARGPDAPEDGFVVHNSIEPIALAIPEAAAVSLDYLRSHLSVGTGESHRALRDCLDTLEILRRCRELLSGERAKIAHAVQELLEGELSGQAEAWWWAWMLPSPLPALLESPVEPRGDLRKLRKQDQEREIDWAGGAKPEEVRKILKEFESEGYAFREAQAEMSGRIAEALRDGHSAAIEAPTGTGKSIAYLLPGILSAEATEAPLVVSTHSKSLQDQLIEKDIPMASRLLGREVSAAKVKGQSNYLCLRKFNEFSTETLALDQSVLAWWPIAYLRALATVIHPVELDRIPRYLKSVFPFLGELVSRSHSHHTTTIGPRCAYYEECHYFDSARLAHQADVIVANHALVFQWSANLPKLRNVVFDEAHHLEDRITEAFSVEAGENEIAEQAQRLAKRRGGAAKRGNDADILASVLRDTVVEIPAAELPLGYLHSQADQIKNRLTKVSSLLSLGFGESEGGFEDFVNLADPAGFGLSSQLEEALSEVKNSVTELAKLLDKAKERSKDIPESDPRLDTLKWHIEKFSGFQLAFERVLDKEDQNSVRLVTWKGRDSTWGVRTAPIDVSKLAEPFFADKRSVVLTSATLTPGGQSPFILERIGLKDSTELTRLPSPFELNRQSLVYVPEKLPMPGTREHLDELIEFTAGAARALGGKTLLLMTSNTRLREAAERLRLALEPEGIEVFDSVSDSRAADAFRRTERALLVGGEKYGEGLDMPGGFRAVIVEKINEAMTRGPLAEARKGRARFAIYDYDFPLRMIWLKQRAGRLIRCATDKGVVVIFDSRYHGWSQGSRNIVRRALDPMPFRFGPVDRVLTEIETHLAPGRP